MRKKLLLILAPLLVLAAILFAYIYTVSHTTHVSFKQYEPTYLPPGLKIGTKTLEIWSSKDNPFSFQKILNLSLGNYYDSIREARHGPKTNVLDCQNLEASADNETCSLQATPAGKEFRFQIVYDVTNPARPSGENLFWQLDNTDLQINWDVKDNRLISAAEWDKTIDSFHQVHYKKLVIQHYSYGP